MKKSLLKIGLPIMVAGISATALSVGLVSCGSEPNKNDQNLTNFEVNVSTVESTYNNTKNALSKITMEQFKNNINNQKELNEIAIALGLKSGDIKSVVLNELGNEITINPKNGAKFVKQGETSSSDFEINQNSIIFKNITFKNSDVANKQKIDVTNVQLNALKNYVTLSGGLSTPTAIGFNSGANLGQGPYNNKNELLKKLGMDNDQIISKSVKSIVASFDSTGKITITLNVGYAFNKTDTSNVEGVTFNSDNTTMEVIATAITGK